MKSKNNHLNEIVDLRKFQERLITRLLKKDQVELELLRFSVVVAKNRLSLDMREVVEILPAVSFQFSRVPGAKKYVRGICAVRGRPYCVLDLSQYLFDNLADVRKGYLLRVNASAGFEAMLLVDAVEGMQKAADGRQFSISELAKSPEFFRIKKELQNET